MDKLIDMFINGNDSLMNFCTEHSISYSKMYRKVRKTNPERLSRKNNGRTKRAIENHPRKITIDEKEMRKLFYIDELTQQQIADMFGVTKGAICYFMKKHSIDAKVVSQSRYWTEEKRERYRQMANDGVIGVFNQKSWKYHTTSLEITFMKVCDKLNIEYRRQYSIAKYGHLYDFFIPSKKLLVEMDGEYWHTMPHQIIKDKEQVQLAIELGYNIVRITDKELSMDPNVIENILTNSYPNLN